MPNNRAVIISCPQCGKLMNKKAAPRHKLECNRTVELLTGQAKKERERELRRKRRTTYTPRHTFDKT